MALIALFSLATARPAAAASFEGLGDLPGGDFNSIALDVSTDGSVVVGASLTDLVAEAFRWTKATGMVGLGGLSSEKKVPSQANGVSADGSVVVGYGTSDLGTEAFRWTEAGGMVGLGDLPGGSFFSQAKGVSDDGSVVVGFGTFGSPFFDFEAFRWTDATGMVGLGDLPGGSFFSLASDVSADGLVVVGQSSHASGGGAFRWTQATGMVGLGNLPGAKFSSSANGVSADGSVVVGVANSASGHQTAFRWTEAGGMVGLGDLPGGSFSSLALDVSADGSVVVGDGSSASGLEAFIWDDTNGMRSLKEVLEDDFGLDLTGWHLDTARGISADGLTIVGYGANPLGLKEAWIARLFTIDIKPGSDTNSINLGAKGGVRVAVITTDYFDASDVNETSVEFAGASPKRCQLKDVDHDGDADLLCRFWISELTELDENSTEATLTGETTGGVPITGTDSVTIVPKGS